MRIVGNDLERKFRLVLLVGAFSPPGLRGYKPFTDPRSTLTLVQAMRLLCRASRLYSSLAQSSAADEQPKRAAASGPGWSEVFISPTLACRTQSAAAAVAAGLSLLLLLELADRSECEELRGEASAVARASRRRSTMLRSALLDDVPDEAVTPGQVRMPIAEMLCDESQALCDRLLLRGVGRLHGSFPTLLPTLFGDSGVGELPRAAVTLTLTLTTDPDPDPGSNQVRCHGPDSVR